MWQIQGCSIYQTWESLPGPGQPTNILPDMHHLYYRKHSHPPTVESFPLQLRT
ncbi:hypothetical protein BJV74DRAFT_819334 [Russula compacta]|nr:hypothetical protein BJV74DRAFT_819334 [Russula compacta]